MRGSVRFFILCLVALRLTCQPPERLRAQDRVRDLQTRAVKEGVASWGHWGTSATRFSNWTSHSNRLIPVYTFGCGLDTVSGANSVYRNEDELRRLYGAVPAETYNPQAAYFDQTDVFCLQQRAVEAGKKYIILFVFDGMDWQTTQAAAIVRSGKVGYRSGRGTGLHMQDYQGAVTDFGFMVTSPHNDGTTYDTDAQTIANPGGKKPGGYDWHRGGATPWDARSDGDYLTGRNRELPHAVTDSASAATSLTAGIKTYNDAINVDSDGRHVDTIAHQLQRQGFAIGVVSSVPISHATPAAAYARNVNRDDYQDLTRDLVGLPSIAHRAEPLPGVDVLLGAGWAVEKDADATQGTNFEPGNRFIAPGDLAAIDRASGGKYRVVHRTAGANGKEILERAAGEAARNGQRLFGMFGQSSTGHLPFRTADGNYDCTTSVTIKDGVFTPVDAERYAPEDIVENPTLADLTRAALDVLAARSDSLWLMVEAGDVDWANHANNIDNSIGAVISGDDAFRATTDWIEAHQAWDRTAVIVTADHGHYLVLDHPEELVADGVSVPQSQ